MDRIEEFAKSIEEKRIKPYDVPTYEREAVQVRLIERFLRRRGRNE
jgi:hypothetical protein